MTNIKTTSTKMAAEDEEENKKIISKENKNVNVFKPINTPDENNVNTLNDNTLEEDDSKTFDEEINSTQEEISTTIEEENDEALTSDIVGETDNNNNLNEERFRVDRKKLEKLLKDEHEGNTNGNFFQQIEQATNTTISWPAKLKIGAKSRKDPYIKVAGLLEDRQKAKQMVLSVMDTKSTRVTLKLDVSFADHSHIIGKGGNTIKRVMKDTQCHIHFPDSNRTSSEKSNQLMLTFPRKITCAGKLLRVFLMRKTKQKHDYNVLNYIDWGKDDRMEFKVSIAGPPFCVESARRQIRELLPIMLKFEIPQVVTVPDSSSPVISSIGQRLNVNITFQQQLRSYNYIGCVKGLHSDPFSVRDAVLQVLEHLTGTLPVTVPVTTQVEIDPKHHVYVVGHNGVNIRKIQQATGANIHFPDPNDPNVRKSTVTISGTIESAVTAKVYLLQYLPLILMFDVRDGENDHLLEQGVLNDLSNTYDVQISVKAKPRQCCKSIIVKGYEKNALNIYKTRFHLIGEDPSNMPPLFAPLATLVIPATPGNPHPIYSMLQQQQQQAHRQHLHQQQQHHLQQQQQLQQNQQQLRQQAQQQQVPVISNVSVETSQAINPIISPPVQSSSPQENAQPPPPPPGNRYISVSPVGQRIVGIEMKMKRLSLDASMGIGSKKNDANDKDDGGTKDGLSSSKSAESILEALRQKQDFTGSAGSNCNKEIESLALSGSWNRQNQNRPSTKPLSTTVPENPLNQSHAQEKAEENKKLTITPNRVNKVGLRGNPNFNMDDYEARKKMAKNVMQSQVNLENVRTPTDAWSGLGFSNSMPEAVIKELWNNRERKNQSHHMNASGNANNTNNNINSNGNCLTSPTTSLDSSVSSNGSSTSAHSHGMGRQSPPSNKTIRRPPPGLGDSRTSLDNLMLNSGNSDYTSILSPSEPPSVPPTVNNSYANVKGIADLFTILKLEQYTNAFEKEEVDLQTFMSLNDDELKELGVSTFGARKRMANAMKDLQLMQNQQQWGATHNNNIGISTTAPPSAIHNGFYNPRHTHAFDVAAHSLRW